MVRILATSVTLSPQYFYASFYKRYSRQKSGSRVRHSLAQASAGESLHMIGATYFQTERLKAAAHAALVVFRTLAIPCDYEQSNYIISVSTNILDCSRYSSLKGFELSSVWEEIVEKVSHDQTLTGLIYKLIANFLNKVARPSLLKRPRRRRKIWTRMRLRTERSRRLVSYVSSLQIRSLANLRH